MITRAVNIHKEPYDVLIDRTTKWGSPFVIGVHGNRKECIKKHKKYLLKNKKLMSQLSELKGKRLGCHCKPKLCHGDTLAFYAELYG